MRRLCAIFLAMIIAVSLCACKNVQTAVPKMEPQIVQMRSICELATMECYYHNVAKFFQDGGEGWFGIDKKDKHFWIEYSGIVKVGVDASLITMKIEGNQVTIAMPPAMVLDTDVDETSLSETSYIVDKESADITASDETEAVSKAQEMMESAASADKTLLDNAQQRAQMLLEDYVENVGKAMGMEYAIKWVYIDSYGELIHSATETTPETTVDPQE